MMPRLSSSLLGVLALATAAAACGDDASGSGGGAATLTPMNGTHLLLTLQRMPGALVAGAGAAPAEVLVAVARDGIDAYDGEVTVALAPESTANGFVAAAAAIARDAGTATLSLGVAPAHLHGPAKVRVVATSKDGAAAGDVSFTLTVRGAPGALDTSFGAGGIVTLGEASAEATGLALQPDGAIVVGGRIGADAALVRLTADGHPDASFGSAGRARVAVPGLVATHDVVVLPGGALLMGGSAAASSFLARFTATGAPDTSFGSAGVVLEPSQSRSRALVVSDGHLYLGGQPAALADRDAMHVLRILPTGVPDPAWGSGGEARLPFPPGPCALGDGECYVSALGAKLQGRLTACASRGDGVAFRDLFASGVEDLNYSVTIPGDVFSQCTAIVNDAANDFWAAGAHGSGLFRIAHFRTSLTGGPLGLDPFVPPTAVPASAGLGVATRLLVGGPGVLVATAETAAGSGGGGAAQVAVVRVHASTLVLDTAFGQGGVVTTAVGAAPSHARALAVQGDGRIVVAGTNGDLFVARYWN